MGTISGGGRSRIWRLNIRTLKPITTTWTHVACGWSRIRNTTTSIVTTNMFGDIITDLGAMIQGGMGVAAGGNINPDPGGTSMFEPMGGSAPKYTGQNVINPIAAIAAMQMLLETGRPVCGRHSRAERHPNRNWSENEESSRRKNGIWDARNWRPRV